MAGRNGKIAADELPELGRTALALASRDEQNQVVLLPVNRTTVEIEPGPGATVKSDHTVVLTLIKRLKNKVTQLAIIVDRGLTNSPKCKDSVQVRLRVSSDAIARCHQDRAWLILYSSVWGHDPKGEIYGRTRHH